VDCYEFPGAHSAWAAGQDGQRAQPARAAGPQPVGVRLYGAELSLAAQLMDEAPEPDRR
jgi:hypothetical protein